VTGASLTIDGGFYGVASSAERIRLAREFLSESSSTIEISRPEAFTEAP
jgi:hypothetical protein